MRLEIADRGPLTMRSEAIECSSDQAPVRIVYASDLHFYRGTDNRLVNQMLIQIEAAQPDAVLLGGDLIDRTNALPALKTLISALQKKTMVGVIAGNHDRWVGVQKIKETALELGAHWLEDESIKVVKGKFSIWVDGRLRNPIPDSSALRILCAHDPAIFPDAVRAGYQIIMAGHLHGCQIVMGQRRGLLYPGAWFYRWNGLRFEQQNSTLLVSRGVSDTLPLRWNCPREMLLCEIGPQ